eukprot:750093-Hanusia_phi.AAC.3
MEGQGGVSGGFADRLLKVLKLFEEELQAWEERTSSSAAPGEIRDPPALHSLQLSASPPATSKISVTSVDGCEHTGEHVSGEVSASYEVDPHGGISHLSWHQLIHSRSCSPSVSAVSPVASPSPYLFSFHFHPTASRVVQDAELGMEAGDAVHVQQA